MDRQSVIDGVCSLTQAREADSRVHAGFWRMMVGRLSLAGTIHKIKAHVGSQGDSTAPPGWWNGNDLADKLAKIAALKGIDQGAVKVLVARFAASPKLLQLVTPPTDRPAVQSG